MRSSNPRSVEWLLAVLAIAMCAASALIVTARTGPAAEPTFRAAAAATPVAAPTPTRTVAATPGPTAQPTPIPPPVPAIDLAAVGAVTTRGATQVRQSRNMTGPVLSVMRAGVNLPVLEASGGAVRVLTPCEVTGWVRADQVDLHTRATGAPASWEQATIVIDPGHGGLQPGAQGPNGLAEKDANLAIVSRLIPKITGARVFVTRTSDHTAGLAYRTRLASALGAHAFVSIHNNSVPDGPSHAPGTEVWHQSRSVASHRLAQFVQSELVQALARFQIDWVSDREAGTRTRLNADGHDYYGLLRGSSAPAVIVEAMFISNAPEAHLLTRQDGQETVAAALERGLKRYVSDPGPDVARPYPGAAGTRGGVPAGCVDPA